MSMFEGLTSRCTSPAACAASSASATGEMISWMARSGGIRPSRAISEPTSPPGTNRIAMNSRPSASPASNTGMMCGSSTAAAALASRMNRCLKLVSSPSDGAMIFSATCRPSRSSTARNTNAMPPRPSCSSMRYPAMLLPTPKSAPMPSPSDDALASPETATLTAPPALTVRPGAIFPVPRRPSYSVNRKTADRDWRRPSRPPRPGPFMVAYTE